MPWIYSMQRWHRDFLCLVVLGFWGLTLTPDFLAQPWLKWWTFFSAFSHSSVLFRRSFFGRFSWQNVSKHSKPLSRMVPLPLTLDWTNSAKFLHHLQPRDVWLSAGLPFSTGPRLRRSRARSLASGSWRKHLWKMWCFKCGFEGSASCFFGVKWIEIVNIFLF